jgi:hypothetical protein
VSEYRGALRGFKITGRNRDDMPIPFSCPACGQRLKAKDGLAGRMMPCPKCRHTVTVPEPRVEDAAAELLLKADSVPPPTDEPVVDAPAAYHPEPSDRPDSLPVPRRPVQKPVPDIATLPPLSVKEPPLWLRHLHWLLVLALIPLVLSLLQKEESRTSVIRRLAESIEKAPPDVQVKILRAMDADDGKTRLDDILSMLPGQKLVGAALPRHS